MQRRAEMNEQELAGFQQLIYRETGIRYPDVKKNLLVTRIDRRMKSLGIAAYGEYLALVLSAKAPDELKAFLNVITTNETYFFRCQRHWEFFRSWLETRRKEFAAKSDRRIRIWSAAASNGSEIYSAAIILAEALGIDGSGVRLELLATDLNDDVLAEAKSGIYHDHALSQTPADTIQRWFKPRPDGTKQLDPRILGMVRLRRHNLMEKMTGPFDLIFLRNVMIYFDAASRTRVLKNAHDALVPDGTLIIGESESLIGVEHAFTYLRPSIFVKGPLPVPAGTKA